MLDRSRPGKTTVRRGTQLGAVTVGGGLLGAVGIVLLAAVVGRSPSGGPPSVASRSHARPSPTSPGATASPMPTLGPIPSVSPGHPPRLVSLPIRSPRRDPRLLYDASPDGSRSAYRDQWSGPGSLHLVRGDGSFVDLDLGPTESLAPQAAAFSDDGQTLAVVDGAGALWTVDVATARATQVPAAGAAGVFGRSVRFGDREHLFVQLVGSVEIPIPSHIAVVHLPDGAVALLSGDASAFGPRPLEDGSVAYFHLNDDGSYVARRLSPSGAVIDIAQVGFAHGGSDLSLRGAVAFSDGTTTWLVTEAGASPRTIGPGTNPRFARDGSTLVAYDPSSRQTELFGLDGRLISSIASPFVAIAACREACQP